MKTFIRILVFAIVLVIGFFGIRFLLKDKTTKSLIIESKYIGDKKEENYTYSIYSNGIVKNTEDNKDKEVKELSTEVIDDLIELIDKVDKDKYTIINTDVAITTGNVVKIYNSKNEEILIKDFYLTNYSDAAKSIFTILSENELY